MTSTATIIPTTAPTTAPATAPAAGSMTLPAAAKATGSRRRTIGLGLLISAQFVVMLDTSIVNVALPSIQPT